MTQHELLIKHFSEGKSLTTGQALTQYGIYALSQRVGDLKKRGYPIESEMRELPNGKKVARYRFKMAENLFDFQ